MRMRLGRPDLAGYAGRFDVPAADGDFSGTFLGVSGLLLDDGESAVMVDGYFSRPPLWKVLLRPLAPDVRRIDAALSRLGVGPGGRPLAAVAPVHTHVDHALDVAVVAGRTDAVLVGGRSAAHIGIGGGLDPRRVVTVTPGRPNRFGGFTLTHLESAHCPPDRFPGVIDAPLASPARSTAYRCGEAWSILVEHTSGRSALVQGSAGFVAGALEGRHADVVYLGVGQLGPLGEQYIRDYWTHTVGAVGARRVVLTHWDDFFRPLDRPLRALPYAGDDLDETMRVLAGLAEQDGVALHLPTVWRREDPWSGL